jgi:hypothetical protein
MMWSGTPGPELEAAIAAREAELLGKPLRVTPLTQDEVTPEMRDYLAGANKAFGGPPSTEISALYLQMMRHFDLARISLDMTIQLCVNGKLPGRDRELTILRVLWLCGSPSPYGEHVFMAKLNGITTEEVRRIREGSTAEGWNEHDRALLSAVEQLVDRKLVDDETWAVLTKDWDDAQKHEFAIVVGQYLVSAIYHNTIRTRCSAYNVGLRQE